MINIKKISDEKYIAVVDLITFESYGLSANNVSEEESFVSIDNLINDIMEKIKFDYKDNLGEFCDVGILVEYEGVIVTLKKSNEESFNDYNEDLDIFEDFEEHLDDVFTENSLFNSSVVGGIDLNFAKSLPINTTIDSSKSLPPEEDFSNGLVAEFNDIESFIKLLNPLSSVLSEDEYISLYYSSFDNIYYLLLNKTVKLSNQFDMYTNAIEDDEVRLEAEYELAEEIFMEYSKIKSFFTERGLKSTKYFDYLEEFCDVIYDSGTIKELSVIFK